MKRKLIKCILAAFGASLLATNANALSFTYNGVPDYSGSLPTGDYTILESFDDENDLIGWSNSFTTQVDGTSDDFGAFTALGAPGTGGSSYDGGVSPTPMIEISSDPYPTSWGRGDLTGGNYLDSGDVQSVLLTFDYTDFDNLFFYLMDPSDQGAVTVSYAGSDNTIKTETINSGNNSDIFMGMITLDSDETLISISWNVNTTADGWGIDAFGTVNNEVPEPATMLLFGTGLAGLAGVARRKKQQK